MPDWLGQRGSRRKVPVLMQQENADCGAACVAMIAAHFGKPIRLDELRHESAGSSRGASFREIVVIAGRLQLVSRALRLSLDEIQKLKLPAILHWRMNHFVVLVRARRNSFIIHDPARGKRRVAIDEFAEAFTGVALEFSPSKGFERWCPQRAPGMVQIAGSFPHLYRYLFTILVLLLVSQLLALLPAIATQLLIDEAVLGQDRVWLLRALAGLGVVLLATLCIDGLRAWIALCTGTRLAIDSSVVMLAHLLNLPAEFVGRRHLGDLMSKLQSMTPLRDALTTHSINMIVQSGVVFSTALLMFVYSPAMAAVSVIGAALTIISTLAVQPMCRRLSEQQLVHRAAQNTSLVETLRSFDSIQAMALGQARLSHWQRSFTEAMNAGFVLGKVQLWRGVLANLISNADQLVFLSVGLTAILNKETTIGVLFAFIGLRARFNSAAIAVVDLLQKFAVLKVHTTRLADIAAAKAVPRPPPGAIQKRVVGAISVENLEFHYAGSGPLFTDLNFEVQQGQHVAITGPSGCGKSTLLKLIGGQLVAHGGSLRIDGIELGLWDRQSLAEQLAIVFQGEQLFLGTVAENISAFDVFPDLERVRQAARIATCWADIQALPMQTETVLGGNGATLSGGQIQRLTLARALYRNPRILLLDEATSQLDVESEKCVLDNIAQLGITVLSVAHRPQAIELASREIRLPHTGYSSGRGPL